MQSRNRLIWTSGGPRAIKSISAGVFRAIRHVAAIAKDAAIAYSEINKRFYLQAPVMQVGSSENDGEIGLNWLCPANATAASIVESVI